MLVTNGSAFSIINYLPEIPKEHDVSIYEVDYDAYQNFSNNGWKFNSKTEKLEPPLMKDSIEKAWIELRAKRDALLSACDWIVNSDVTISSKKKQEWLTYRQTLRDLPSVVENPTNDVIWPEKP